MALQYKEQLREIFLYNGITEQQIDEVINIVLEQQTNLSEEEKFEEMVNLLIESGDSTLATALVQEEETGACGVTLSQKDNEFERLMLLFPGISPEFLRNFCKPYETFDFDQIVNDLGQTDYVRVDKDPLDIWSHLKEMLPNADPSYLKNQARVLATRSAEELQEFVENAVEKQDYPTLQQYLIKQEIQNDFDFYITKFTVRGYLARVPDPIEKYFDPNREPVLTSQSPEEEVQFALDFLYNNFLYLRKNEIAKVFKHFNQDLVKSCNKLRILPKAFRRPREKTQLILCKNIELLKVVAFLGNEKAIRQHLKQQDDRYKRAFEEAKLNGFLQSCGCCYDDQLIPEECYLCQKGCKFCKECVRSGAAYVIGKEETSFPCLADCDSEFHYSTLQMVLDAKTFEGICHRKQIEDIRKANIDGLETCPFCDFCMIPDEGDLVFKCGNIECMAETCRKCQHRAHIPLRCNEIEYDEDVKMRTHIENKMTEALLRKCWNCAKSFYKESGCNKMTCICGARTCYVCGQRVENYSHFSNAGCPLYTDNLQAFHLNRVLQGAQAAKAELGINEDPTKLKFDPARDVERDIV